MKKYSQKIFIIKKHAPILLAIYNKRSELDIEYN